MTDTMENAVTVTESGLGPYAQFVTAGRHIMGADEPEPLGGRDTGASPYEYLLAGLGACTAMTLRMYATRKSWPLEKIAVELRHEKIAAPSGADKIDRFERVIRLTGALTNEQKSKLLEIAERCPISQTLELPGIGKDLAGKIVDIVKTGRFKLLDTLKRRLPGELGEIAALPGLGPRRVKLLYDRLKVRTLADLKRAVESGRLRKIRGFGPTIEQKLLQALKQPRSAKRFKLPVAEAAALVALLRDGRKVVVAGSYRRRRETVGDLDVLATAEDGAAIGQKLASYENVAEVMAQGSTRTTVVLRSGIQVDLRVVREESYGAALL